MKLQLFLFALLLILSVDGTAQASKKDEHTEFYNDSIALDYLKDIYPDRNIGWSEILLNNKRQKVRNFHSQVCFRLPAVSNDTIVAVSFGINSDHEPCFMLVIWKNDQNIARVLLGKESLNAEVSSLQNFITNLAHPIEEKYQLELWDLFVKCRQGVSNMPLYIH